MRRRSWMLMGGSAAALALVAAAVGGTLARPATDAANAPTQIAADLRPVRVQRAHAENLTAIRRYAGVVRPRIEAEIGFRVIGKLQRRLVDVGDRFAAGAVLATLDPVDLDLRLAAARAKLVSATAEARNARSELERYAALRAKGWSTQQNLDERRSSAEAAEARVREMRAQQDLARNDRSYGELKGDAAGVVTEVMAEPGRVLGDGDPVLKVAYADALEIEAEIPEHQVAELAAGRLSVTLWALPGLVLEGRLRELSPIASGSTRTYRARVALVGAGATTRAVQMGMTATLTAEGGAQPATRLPMASIVHDQGRTAVWIVGPDGRTLELRPVEVRSYTSSEVVLASGVAEGEPVVTAGVHKLDAGQAVRIWTEPDR